MASKYIPLTINGIEQGEFLKKLEQQFIRISKGIVRFVESEKAEKASASLNVKIVMDYKESGYLVRTDIESKMPKKKVGGVSRAMIETGEDGELCLFAKATGSAKSHPKQEVMVDDDGAAIGS